MKKSRLAALVIISVLALYSCEKPSFPELPGDNTEQPGDGGDDNPGSTDPTPEPEKPGGYDPYGDNGGKIPVIYINTPSAAPVDKKEWVEKATISLVYPDGTLEDLGKTKIKLRGNSTLFYPKKSYNIKLEKKASLVNMPKDKSWCLLAQWMDKTMLRNDVSFEIAKRTRSIGWTPRGEFVELVLNDTPLGAYYLCERIKMADHRVMAAKDGYILELDTYYDEKYRFHSAQLGLPVMLKEPDEEDITADFFEGVKTFFNTTEAMVCTANYDDYRDRVDMDSFIDWFFVHELSGNYEPGHPKSTYMHLAQDGKLHAGPVWDFDWDTYNPDRKVFALNKSIWFKYFLDDPVFVERMKEKWVEELTDFITIPDYIDLRSVHISSVAKANFHQWPITQTVNGDENMSWEDAVQRMKTTYIDRVNRLNSVIAQL